MRNFIYFFSQAQAEGNSQMADILGGKGANLAQMAKLGIPVPPGFTISTEVCTYFYKNNQNFPPGLEQEIKEAVSKIEELKSSKFGDTENPLLLSIRSGARVSMPGMMDTVLNLGLNDKTVEGLAKISNQERFAYDCYRRFLMMFGDVVMNLPREELDEILEEKKKEKGIKLDIELDAKDLKEICQRLKIKIEKLAQKPVPQDPWQQLWEAITAVFKSWNTPRAITYRKLNKIPDNWGTAVNVQAMVFGNLNKNCGTGVGFTRDPATGEKKMYGEFLETAQGEDVVAGIRTPKSISQLQEIFPECYSELLQVCGILEDYFKEMQDIEFTIENGKLWMLQTRNGKRTVQAAVKIALDMVNEGLIDKKQAILRIKPESVEGFFKPSFDQKIKKDVLAKGLAASPGAAVGQVVFDPTEAEELVDKGQRVILVRMETSPDDIHGMAVAEGILTSRGGFTSHAALVARGMGKPCIVGCEAIYVDYKNQLFQVGDKTIKKGEKISLDGESGEVYFGEIPTLEPKISDDLNKFLEWADEIRTLKVYTNADTPLQVRQARNFGAEGVGLCRTEHMFFEENRIPVFQQMILVKDKKEREEALNKILPLQKSDFIEIFKEMAGYPVTIRLLDPPLHEFLPKNKEGQKKLAEKLNISEELLVSRVEALQELNPMLGFRGCRLSIVFPEIYEMQAKAIMEAAGELSFNNGLKVFPKIMIPLTMDEEEFRIVKESIKKICQEIEEKEQFTLSYKIGTMIELPRASLLANEIAREAEFFSFGTNDLTQTTLGISRDDAGRFLPSYVEKKIFKEDPFLSIDEKGLGQLIKIGKERGKQERPDLDVGICGEHGGDPSSIKFCHKIGLDYVSCSPFRVPVARLAAAQAALSE